MSIRRRPETSYPSQQDVLLTISHIVRGEKPWSDLQRFGITFLIEENTYREENPKHVAGAVNAADLASGLVRYWDHLDELRRWAFIVLAASFIDLSDLETHPEGDALLSVVWEAGFGNPVNSDMFRLARRIATPR